MDWEETLVQARQQFAAGSVEDSERLYGELASLMPASDRRYAECLERLIFLKKRTGRYEQALPYSARLIQLGEQFLGSNNASVIAWKNDLIETYRHLGRYDDAQFVLQSLPGYNAVPLEEELIDAYASSPGLANSIIQQVEEPEEESEAAAVDPAKFIKGVAAEPISDTAYKKILGQLEPLSKKLGLHAPLKLIQRVLKAHFNDILSGISVLIALVLSISMLYYAYAPSFTAEVEMRGAKPLFSSDRINQFKFLSNKRAELQSEGKSFTCSYWRYTEPFGFWTGSLASGLFRREIWMKDNERFLCDEYGTTYFYDSSEEATVLEVMRQVADSCQRYYLEKGRYPDHLEDINGIKFSYHNPFTARKDKPLLQEMSIEEASSQPSEKIIKNLLNGFLAGGLFPNEPVPYPGGVNACLIVVNGQDTQNSLLVVHGAGRDGKFITDSGRGRTLVLTQQNGRDVHFAKSGGPLARSFFGFGEGLEFRPSYICILSERICSLPLGFLKYRGIFIFLAFSGVFGFIYRFYSAACLGRKFTGILSMVCLAAAIGCIFNCGFP